MRDRARRYRGPRRFRGQVSLSLLEAAIGVLLVLSVTATFALGPVPVDAPSTRLDRAASDAATTLRVASGDGSVPRIDRALRSERSFEAAIPALRDRLDRLLPANLLYRVQTVHGTIGHPRPERVPVGRARLATGTGDVVVEVWYV